VFFSKPQSWCFQAGLIAEEYLDLWQGCVLALPFWDYQLRICEDLSGNGLHALFATGVDPATDWEVSTYGSYLDLEGAAAEDLSIAAPPGAWIDGTSKLSIEIICRTDNTTGIKGLIGKYTTTTDRRSWRLYLNGAEIALQVSSDGAGNEIQESTNASIGVNNWKHFVVTFDAGVFKVWMDGVALTTDGNFTTHTSIFAGVVEPIKIFARSDGNRLAGGIAGIRVWKDRVLGEGEVRRLYEDPWGMYEPIFPLSFLPTFAQEHSGGAAAGPWILAGTAPKGAQEFLVGGLMVGTSYDIQTKSVDLSGNTSAGTTPVAGTPIALTGSSYGIGRRPRISRSRPVGAKAARMGR
jgi:hypothetical protein